MFLLVEQLPEVIGPFPLAEATAWNKADASLLKQSQTVHHVRSHSQGLQKRDKVYKPVFLVSGVEAYNYKPMPICGQLHSTYTTQVL